LLRGGRGGYVAEWSTAEATVEEGAVYGLAASKIFAGVGVVVGAIFPISVSIGLAGAEILANLSKIIGVSLEWPRAGEGGAALCIAWCGVGSASCCVSVCVVVGMCVLSSFLSSFFFSPGSPRARLMILSQTSSNSFGIVARSLFNSFCAEATASVISKS